MSRSILIVEDAPSMRESLAALFEAGGTRVIRAATLDEAKQALATEPYDLILTGIRLGTTRNGGLQVMAAASLLSPDAVIIALTALPDPDGRLAAMRLGAAYVVEQLVDLSVVAALASKHGVPSALFPRAATRDAEGVALTP